MRDSLWPREGRCDFTYCTDEVSYFSAPENTAGRASLSLRTTHVNLPLLQHVLMGALAGGVALVVGALLLVAGIARARSRRGVASRREQRVGGKRTARARAADVDAQPASVSEIVLGEGLEEDGFEEEPSEVRKALQAQVVRIVSRV